MAGEWVLLHGGALGDLALSIQLALRLTMAGRHARLSVISRTDPGDLSGCAPAIVRRSLEGLSSHWLYATDSGPPPAAMRAALAGRPVLNALGDDCGSVHRRLHECGVSGVFSFDPRPRGGPGHITAQWQRDLERQTLLFPECAVTGREATSMTPNTALVQRGRAALRATGVDSEQYVLIHPGSGSREKCWPQEGFVAVAQRLRVANRPVAFVIGPVEHERLPAGTIERLRCEFPVCAPGDASELAALLSACDVLLSNDSGPAHLAALLDRRTITLFGPTCAETWRPIGPRGAALQGRPEAGPYWGLDADVILAIALEYTESRA